MIKKIAQLEKYINNGVVLYEINEKLYLIVDWSKSWKGDKTISVVPVSKGDIKEPQQVTYADLTAIGPEVITETTLKKVLWELGNENNT